MPKILLVRPGQTNEQGMEMLVGRQDPDLDETGRWQARRLANRFVGSTIHHIAVNPQKRAVSTAMYICEIGDMIPELVRGFEGVDLGEWESKSRQWLLGCDATRFDKWSSDADFPAPGGESLRNVYRRAFPPLVELVERVTPDESIMVVAPGTVIRVLCCGILDLPLKNAMNFRVNFGAVSTFERLYPGGPYQVVQWNDVSHLEQPETAPLEFNQETP